MRAEFVRDAEAALGAEGVVKEPEQLRTYECDGLTGYRVVPGLVALPRNTEDVQAVVRLCARDGIPFVARGAGTGLSGGALPVAEGIVVSLARLNRILGVDLESARVTLQPGVTNLAVTEAVAPHGFYYAPDPSSQQVCTIGGNVAENSGGAHCLKHGFTVNHVLEAEGVIAARILPAAIEMMDRLTIEAAEAAVHPGYPDVGAVLIVELDGLAAQVEEDLAAVEAICRTNGASEVRVAADEAERALLWRGRRSAFAAMGRGSHDYYVQDGGVPRTRLAAGVPRIAEAGRGARP